MIQPTYRIGYIVLLAVILLDQLTKHMILGTALPITVTPFFNLVLVWNEGISFGMLQDMHDVMPYVLSALALGICTWLHRWLQDTHSRVTAVALGLIIGGAIGNVFDRLQHGSVVDFLDFHAFGYHWPSFNVADASICIGVIMLLLGGRHKNA